MFSIDYSILQHYPFQRDDFRYYSYKIISSQLKCLYLEYPKAASGSIKRILLPRLLKEHKKKTYYRYCLRYYKNKILGQAPPIWPFAGQGDEEWRKIIPQAHFVGDVNTLLNKDFFLFTVVRNPFDKMVSAYKHGLWGMIDTNTESFDEFIESLLPGGTRTLRDVLDRGLNHFLPWTMMFPYSDRVFFARFENLQADFEVIRKRLMLSVTLPHVNRSRGLTSYRGYYTVNLRNIVEELFRSDLELFDYDF